MAFEIVPAPHLPPYVCMACGCANGEPHVFIPHNQAWEQAYPFICKPCVAEMAGALGITKAEPVEPSEAEMTQFFLNKYGMVPDPGAFVTTPFTDDGNIAPAAAPEFGQPPIEQLLPAQLADRTPPEESKATCLCGVEFTGPTAKAKLGSHQRTCTAFHERAAAKFAKEAARA